MHNHTFYYDHTRSVLILVPDRELPIQIDRERLVWEEMVYDGYWRAICLGQGDWENLDIISEEAALGILTEWAEAKFGPTEEAVSVLRGWLLSELDYPPETAQRILSDRIPPLR